MLFELDESDIWLCYHLAVLCIVRHTLCSTIYNTELGILLGLEPVNLVIKKSRLVWFGHRHDECTEDIGFVKDCTVVDDNELARAHPRETWWDGIEYDMKRFCSVPDF